ncbi:MAG: peptidoglycan-binding protein [Hyphomicrobium sp.]|uniref:peptidoglycan-binding domain-containing protein n=1 Tax=Hyphomicrobium sp. TaxID=82 RepID=UPI003D1381ED
MRWYVGYPILAAGLAFGFETLFPGEPEHRAVDAAMAQALAPDAGKEPTVVLASEIGALPKPSRIASFSPGSKLTDADPSSSSVLDYLAQALTPVAPAPQPVTLRPVTVTAWKSAVVPAAKPQPGADPTGARIALARDIQRELRRVGCYVGEIDGVWGGGSKRALLTFLDRVNASLPSRDPDVIMLTLVRAQGAAVCSATCPQGQSLTTAGRCMPTTILAHADKGKGRAPDASQPSVTEAAWADAGTRGAEPFGRMSIGGPKPEEVAQLTAGWSRPAGAEVAQDDHTPARTALLDEGEIVPAAPEAATAAAAPPSSFDGAAAEPPAKRAKSSAKSGKPRWRTASGGTYRHVQRLFTHPLGM